MELFLLLLVSGVVTGCVYGIVAVSVTVVYRVSGVLNMALGAVAVIGAITAANLATANGVPRPLAAVVAIVAVMVLVYAFDATALRWIYRRGASLIEILFVLFGFSIVLSGLTLLLFGRDQYTAPPFVEGEALSLAGGYVPWQGVIVIVATVVIGIALALYLNRSMIGKAMTACSDNAFGCRIVGIPLSRLRSIALVGGSGLAALAGIMILPVTPMLYTSGLDLTLKGLIAASVVGLASPMRGLLMGIALGVGESLVATYGPSNFQEAIVYSILAVVLLARPQLVASAKLH